MNVWALQLHDAIATGDPGGLQKLAQEENLYAVWEMVKEAILTGEYETVEALTEELNIREFKLFAEAIDLLLYGNETLEPETEPTPAHTS